MKLLVDLSSYSDSEIQGEYTDRNLQDPNSYLSDDHLRDEFFLRRLGYPIEVEDAQMVMHITNNLNCGLDQTKEMTSLIERLSGTLIAPRKKL